jgi:hypothetical protein
MRQGILLRVGKAVGVQVARRVLVQDIIGLDLIYQAYWEASEPVGEESSPGVFPRLRSRRDLRVWGAYFVPRLSLGCV